MFSSCENTQKLHRETIQTNNRHMTPPCGHGWNQGEKY